MEYSNAFVCLMGLGIVFFGLICLVALTTVMSLLCGRKQPAPAAPAAAVPAAPEVDRQALVAAVSAALAEELGTDVTGIRILSLKKL
ncbi:OadG family protein [uncultured Oscillibacter sp.]|uniref:OadG family protein n=1 Tax=uncultured Oscillibacter sp. TaxID=876091 RepID=UPI002805C7F2|nr:OadG family protein [uncultured Oscillibacter sp.]